MDGETWLNAEDAIAKGFASEIIQVKTAEPQDNAKKAKAMARRTMEMALKSQGLSRKECEEIFEKAFGVRDAIESPVRDAGNAEDWAGVLKAMQT